MEFKEWLINEKKYKERSALDIISRNRRAKNILNIEELTKNTEKELESNEKFKKLSCSVRSQIRISIRIWLEYKGEKKNND